MFTGTSMGRLSKFDMNGGLDYHYNSGTHQALPKQLESVQISLEIHPMQEENQIFLIFYHSGNFFPDLQ